MSRTASKYKGQRSASESGQGFVEYILILSFALMTSVALARTMGAAMDRGVLLFGGQLEKDLKTGKTPVQNGWKN